MTPHDDGPTARRSDPVGLARLHRVIAEQLASEHPGTRWVPLPVDGSEEQSDDPS